MDTKLLVSRLAKEKKIITDSLFSATNIKLKQIEKEIEIKEQTVKQNVIADQLMLKIKEATKEIDKIHPHYTRSTGNISKLKAELLQLQRETDECNLRDMFLQRLNEEICTSRSKINSIQEKRKAKIRSEIDELKLSIIQLDVTYETFEQRTSQQKALLNMIETKIKQAELEEEINESFLIIARQMYLDINVKMEDSKQATLARNIFKEIQELIIQIVETVYYKENMF